MTDDICTKAESTLWAQMNIPCNMHMFVYLYFKHKLKGYPCTIFMHIHTKYYVGIFPIDVVSTHSNCIIRV